MSATAIAPQTEHILGSDNVSVTLRYEDGSVATLLYTALGSPDFGKEYMELYADGKVLVLDDYRALRVHGAAMKGWAASVQEKGHLEELRELACSIQRESEPPIPLEELIETTRVSIIVGKYEMAKCSGRQDSMTESAVNISKGVENLNDI